MSDPYFFGYGSLVNCDTHVYPNAQKARLHGWARAWVAIEAHDVVLLSAIKAAEECHIDGLIASVPQGDWQALDAREEGYQRLSSTGQITSHNTQDYDIAHYAVATENMQQNTNKHILLSYLDVVVQGYFRQFGEKGVADFFDTTQGWDTEILNDRAQPQYPRHQKLSATETALVDTHLDQRNARITSL